MRKSRFVYSLLLLLVIVTIILVKRIDRKNDDAGQVNVTPTLNIYKNTQLGFELPYPSNWFYNQVKGGSLTPLGVFFSDDKEFIDSGSQDPKQSKPYKWINFSLYKTKQNINEYSSADLKLKKATISTREEIKINDLPALKIISKYNGGTYLSSYVKVGDYIYLFESFVNRPEDFSEVENIFNSMVSGFKLR